MNNKIILIFALFLIVFPIINAASIEDAINQQMSTSAVNYRLAQDLTPEQAFKMAMENNPELKAQFQMFIRFLILLAIILVIDLVLRGLAMWKAAKNNSKIWFWILLLISTMGILPVLYLILAKKPQNNKK